MRVKLFPYVLSISIVLIVAGFSSCTKTTPKTNYYVVTEEDAAEIVSNAVLQQDGGLITQINDCITLDQKPGLHCGLAEDTLLKATNPTGASTTYNKNMQWQYQVNCADKSITSSYSGSCNYNALHFSATDQASGTVTSTPSLAQTLTANYQLSLTLHRSGSAIKQAINTNNLTTSINIQSTDMVVNPVTKQIISGTMSVNIDITSGIDYTFAGTIRFLGNGKATMMLNSNTAYQLSL